jgi:tetratricopeptide (TPR) repeat protein
MKLTLVLMLTCVMAAEKPEPHIKAAAAAVRDGQSAAKVQDWPRGEKLLLRAIDIEPTFTEAYRSLIELYLTSERPLEAGAILTRLVQIEPRSVDDRLRLGNLLLDQRQWARALAQFSIALKIDPHSADGLFGFARSADGHGMTDRALESADLGTKEFPGDPRFSMLAAAIRARASRPAP